MTSAKPYFIQALHQWITDNGMTPLIVIDASYEGLRVPPGIEEDGNITLNVSYDATDHMTMDPDLMTFNARFGGRSQALIVPMESITALFARENGKGMVFEMEDHESEPPPPKNNKNDKDDKPKRPHLTVVD